MTMLGIGGFLYSILITIAWIMTIYSLNFYYLCYQSRHNPQHNKRQTHIPKIADERSLPQITVQLPLYNEKYVAARLIDAVCKIDYPKNKLEIQILDDSDDETVELIERLVMQYQSQGFDLIHIRRGKPRTGYKAGALKLGMRYAKGEFIAIFDADFIPPFWFLKEAVRYFSDPSIGLVQCRWGHINEEYSTLTAAQAVSLDLHFLIEQKARSLNHLFMNFNGAAGIWRASCIKDAGGWHTSTLVEDLDLSFRAQMKGWKSLFLENIVVQAELPVQMNAAKRQQYRWAKGSMQVAIKLLNDVLSEKKISLDTKIQAFIQLTRHIVHPLFLTQFLIFPILLALDYKLYTVSWAPIIGIVIYIILGPAGYMYMIRKLWPDRWVQKARQYLFLILFAVGISVNNTAAIFDAIGGSRNEFLRTPKFGIIKRGEDWKNNEYTLPFTRTTLLEIFFALYGCIATAISLFTGNFIFTPIIVLQTAGFSYIAYFSMTHSSFTNNKQKIDRQNIPRSQNKTSIIADSAGFRVKCTGSINIATWSKGKIVSRVTRPNYYYNGSYRNYNNKDSMSGINRRLVLFGILGFFLLGAALAFYGYEKTIYPIDRAVGYLSRAQSAQTPQAVAGYLQSAVALLPKDGNPVWIFPNPGTDFILIQKELDSMILRTRYISIEEPNGAAYNTGLQDLRDSIKIIENNLQEANPYLYISITNIFLGSVWIFVIIFIFAVLRRGRSKIKEYETP